MARFRYSMQSILNIKLKLETQAKQEFSAARAALDREEFTRDNPRRTKVCVAQLGNDAGIIGGALVPMYR